MNITTLYKKCHDSMFVYLVPKELRQDLGSELHIRAQAFLAFALLSFIFGLPNLMFLAIKYKFVICFYLLFFFLFSISCHFYCSKNLKI